MKQTLIIVTPIVLLFILLSLLGFYLAIRPFRIISSNTPKDFNIRYETVSFYTRDGVQLQGWFIPCPNPKAKTIILLHGYPADKGDILPSRLFLHEDYHLLFFDFRYFGKSGGHYSTLGKNEVLDLQGAIEYLHSRGIHEVGVWGFSLGGAVALMTAPSAPEIKAIVAESSYARLDWLANEYYRIPLLSYALGELTRLWGIVFLQYDLKKVSPIIAAENLKIPVLLIHSKQDNVIPFRHALALEKALKHDPQLEVIFTDNQLHGEPIKNYQAVISDFFDRSLNHTKPK